MEALTSELIKLGVPGLIAAAALYWAYKKDRQLELVYKHWVKKAEQQTTKYHEFSAEHMAVIRELTVAHQKIERLLRGERIRHDETDPYRGPTAYPTPRQTREDPRDR